MPLVAACVVAALTLAHLLQPSLLQQPPSASRSQSPLTPRGAVAGCSRLRHSHGSALLAVWAAVWATAWRWEAVGEAVVEAAMVWQ